MLLIQDGGDETGAAGSDGLADREPSGAANIEIRRGDARRKDSGSSRVRTGILGNQLTLADRSYSGVGVVDVT
jgi:hypothetical protein